MRIPFSLAGLTHAAPSPPPPSNPIPRGVFSISPNGWTSPLTVGRTIRASWNVIQPTDSTHYDWSSIDSELQRATDNNKVAGLGVSPLPNTNAPAWAIAGLPTYSIPLNNNTIVSCLPWDIQAAWLPFVQALCQRYNNDPRVTYIIMSGLGTLPAESVVAPDAATIGMTTAAANAAFQTNATQVALKYSQYCTAKPFTFTIDVPYHGQDQTLIDLINTLAPLYANKMALRNCALNALTNISQTTAGLIHTYRATNPGVFQAVWSWTTDPSRIQGSFEDMVTAAETCGAQALELYGSDVGNPALAATISDAERFFGVPGF